MNRFEQAVYGCMKPTANFWNARQSRCIRAILPNFWRHVHLEGAGEYHKTLAPDMTVYRLTWGANPAVIEGKEGVRPFYHSVGEAVPWPQAYRL